MADLSTLLLTFSVVRSDTGAHITMKREHEIHDTETLDCWCRPDLHVLCSECDASDGGCWRCESGLVRVTREDAEFSGEPIVVVHNG